MQDRLEIIEAYGVRHRCLLGAWESFTLAKSVSLDNLKPRRKSKLELLAFPPRAVTAGTPREQRHGEVACAGEVRVHSLCGRTGAHAGYRHMGHDAARMLLRPSPVAPTRRFDATDNAPPVPERCLGQILVRGEIVHKGQGQAAKAFGIRPVTPGAIERVMAPDELRPVRRGLALMGGERIDFSDSTGFSGKILTY